MTPEELEALVDEWLQEKLDRWKRACVALSDTSRPPSDISEHLMMLDDQPDIPGCFNYGELWAEIARRKVKP